MGVIVDGEGRVVGHSPISSWLEDPGEVLSDEFKLITRLDEETLAGQSIDEHAALSILNRAEMIVAHNASYDAPIMERRQPTLAGRAWPCSVRELDWLRLGYDGAKLGHLVMQAGWSCNGHRAAVDVAALFHLLQVSGSIGGDMPRTHFERLLERADQPIVSLQCVRVTNTPLNSRHAAIDGPRKTKTGGPTFPRMMPTARRLGSGARAFVPLIVRVKLPVTATGRHAVKLYSSTRAMKHHFDPAGR